MLEVDGIFEEKVEVPGITNVHELATILKVSKTFNSDEISQVITAVRQHFGSDTIRIGIKRIRFLISKAKGKRPDSDFLELFLDLLVKEVQNMALLK